MARFYGSVKGSRGKVTRLGGASSGLTAIAATWSGAVAVHVFDAQGTDWCLIELTPWHNAGTNAVLYNGPVSKLHALGLTEHGKKARHITRGHKV